MNIENIIKQYVNGSSPNIDKPEIRIILILQSAVKTIKKEWFF